MKKSAGSQLADLLWRAGRKGTTAYDTTAQVVRSEGDTLWVHIPGGVDETPVRKTINAIPGDSVQIRVSNGKAWITGNRTSPPTDDATAIEALNISSKTSRNFSILNERVNDELDNAWTEITQNANEIRLKASAEYVDNAKSEAISTANAATDSKLAEYTKTAEFSVAPDMIASTVSAAQAAATNDANNATDQKLRSYSTIEQTAEGLSSKVSTTDYTGQTVASLINQSADSVKIKANHIEIDGAATFNAIKSQADETYDSKGAANAVQNTLQNKINSANSQEQIIYYRSNSTTAPIAPSTWITSTATANSTWSTKRMQFDSTYKYLYTCIQRKTVGGVVTNSTVLLDDTTTVIDGGNIITGTITANKLNASNINASNSLTIGALNTSTQSDVLNSNVQVGGRNLLVNSKLRKSGSSNGISFAPSGSGSQYCRIYGTASATVDQWVADLQYLSSYTNMTVTISANAVFTDSANNYFYVSTSKNGAWYKDYQKITWYSSTERSLTINLENGETLRYLRVHLVSGTTVDGAYRVKVELGNKQTDWSPAPEDVQGDITATDTNMLFDWDAQSVIAEKAKSNRYWGGNSSTTTQTFFTVTDPPEANIHYGGRVILSSSQTSDFQTALSFYSGADVNLIPYKVGNSYTISCWARCTSGSGRVRLYYRNNSSAVAATPVTTLSSTWKRVYGVFTPTVVDYGRVYFYANFAAGTTGTVEMCGFRLVSNGDSAEATKYITHIDDNGIRIHPSSNQNNAVVINASGMTVYKGGTAAANSVAFYGDTARVGKTGTNNVQMDGNGLNLYNNGTRVGTLQQVSNYSPSYSSDTYANACFLNAAQYLAMYIKSTPSYGANDPFPMFETDGESVSFNFGEGNLFLEDTYDTSDGTGGPIVSLQNSNFDRTSQETWFDAMTEDADVQFGIGPDGVTKGIYDADGDKWIIGMDSTGLIFSPNIYAKTSSTGSNVRVGTSGKGNLVRYVSSSRRYKEDIEDLSNEDLDPEKLYNARVVQFRYKDDYLDDTDQRYGRVVPGFIAEEIEEIYPIAVNYEDGLPEDWEPKFIIPPMLKLIQDQKKEIEELKAKVHAIEKRR